MQCISEETNGSFGGAQKKLDPSFIPGMPG